MNPLEILEITPGSSMDEAKKKYRSLCVKYHPDKNPDTEDQYRSVVKAYRIIKENPSLLQVPKVSSSLPGFINYPIEITLEDIYFCREKAMEVERTALCFVCSGTGAELGVNGICSHCDGKGEIKGTVMNLMKRSPTCPECKGSGIKGNVCKKCNGIKVQKKLVRCTFRLNMRSYFKKMVILKGMGNINSRGYAEDLHIRLKIKPMKNLFIEDDYFLTYAPVLPIQKIIGDIGYISLFGRKLKYKIYPYDSDDYIHDKVSDTLTREIRVKFFDVEAPLNEDTKELYNKILKIEKKLPWKKRVSD